MEKLSISKTVSANQIPIKKKKLEKIKDAVLGKKYELSVVFIGDKLSRKINKEYRHKDKSANVLSFPLSDNDGEIFINVAKARSESKKFDMNHIKFVTYLFIHGILHLKGLKHGKKMNAEEQKLLKKYTS